MLILFVCLNIFRYIAVFYPLRYSNIITPRTSALALTVIWIYAFFTGMSPFYCGRWSENINHCLLKELLPPVYIYIALTGQFVTCSLIMIILYSKIFYVAKQQKRKIECSMVSNYTSAKSKATKTLALVLGVFLIFWTPFFCLASVQSAGIQNDILDQFYFLSLFLGLTNSCLNPVIYCWKSSEFRTAYIILITRICKGKR